MANSDLNLRFYDKTCWTCKYFRIHTTGASASECLLLGRTLGITGEYQSSNLISWGRERVCDGWKKRPRQWNIYSKGTDTNPHWVDPYLSRKTLTNLKLKLKLINKCEADRLMGDYYE